MWFDVQARHAFLVYQTPTASLRKWRTDIAYPAIPDVLSGTESDGIPQLTADESAEVKALLFGDVCPRVATLTPTSSVVTTPTVAECRSFDGGIMSTGFQYAFQRYLDLSAAMIDRTERTIIPMTSTNGSGVLYVRPPTASTTTTFNVSDPVWANATVVPYSIPAVLSGPEMDRLSQYNLRFIEPIAEHISDIYRDRVYHVVDGYRMFVALFLSLSLAAITASIVFLFLPAIRRLDRDLHHKRALLLLLPPQTLVYVPTLRAFVEDILASSGLGGGGGGGASSAASRRSGRSSMASVDFGAEAAGGGGGGGGGV